MDPFYTFGIEAKHTVNSLNHVRLPVGYWAFEVGAGEPYISGQLPYVQRAVGWAQKYGLKVIFDLHGKPLLLLSLIAVHDR